MKICQPIKAKTKTLNLDIVLIKEGEKFSVLMSGTAFPVGTLFDSPEEALKASIKALSIIFHKENIESLYSNPVEEFIKNEQMANFLP